MKVSFSGDVILKKYVVASWWWLHGNLTLYICYVSWLFCWLLWSHEMSNEHFGISYEHGFVIMSKCIITYNLRILVHSYTIKAVASGICCFSPGVSIWDLDHHKLPLCLPQRFWHLYHLNDPPSVTMQSSNYKCGGQRNVRLLTSLLHADWNDIAEFQSYCSHSLTIEQRPSMCSFSSSFGGHHPTGNVLRGYQPILAQSSGGWPETIEHWPCFCLEKDK